MKTVSLVLAAATVFVGCRPNAPPPTLGPESQSFRLNRTDIQEIVKVVVNDALGDTKLTSQPTIPLKVEGYSGSLPDAVLGKPVCRLDDVDAFLNNHYKADDIENNNVLVLRLLEQNERGLRMSVFHSRGWGGFTKAELWLVHTGSDWRLDTIVSRQEML